MRSLRAKLAGLLGGPLLASALAVALALTSALAVALTLTLTLLAPAAVQAQPAPAETPLALVTASGTIDGSLLAPAGRGPWPVALLIGGSGPTDRNGNNPALKNDSLRLLATALAAQGIATVRFDKRGIGASAAAGPSEADLRFDTYVQDAAAWIALLRKDKRFSAVSVVGHSEGALIGMLAATAVQARAVVSIAGAGRPAGVLLREQLSGALPPPLKQESDRILAALEAGRLAADVPPALAVLYRPSVQPYLISYLRHAPATVIAALPMPVLIVQGTTDLQVKVSDAEALHTARPGAQLVLVAGMNHVLKLADGDKARQMAVYSDPSLPVAPAMVSAVATFIIANSK